MKTQMLICSKSNSKQKIIHTNKQAVKKTNPDLGLKQSLTSLNLDLWDFFHGLPNYVHHRKVWPTLDRTVFQF